MSDGRPRNTIRRRDRWVASLGIALIALAVYLWNDNHVRIGDTFPARLLPLSILDEGNLDFNEFEYLAGPGHSLEESYQFNRVDGRLVSYYSIVPGLLNLPAHAVARALGVDGRQALQKLSKVTASIVAASSVFFMTWVLGAYCERRSALVALGALYAFGTSVFSVTSTALWQHGPSLLFLTAGFAALLSHRREGAWVAGLMLGMAVWNRAPNVAYAAAAAGYLLAVRRRDLPWLIFGGAIPAVAMSIYSWLYWGSVTALGEGHSVSLLSGPLVANLAGTLFSPNRGLFVFTPVFLLALPQLARVLRGPRDWPFEFALSVAMIFVVLIHSLWTYWWGGESFGYRLLTETIPVFMILLAQTVGRGWARHRSAIAALGVLGLLSIYVHTLGAFYYPSDWNQVPRPIDEDPDRAWDLRDTELGRLQRKALGRNGRME